MRILTIDTATPRILVGIVDVSGGAAVELASDAHEGATAHAEVLAPSIKAVTGRAGVALTDLDGIVVGLGPGPFTGLRVGIVTAAALGDALALAVWGVCSLDAMAPADARSLVVTDARRKELYFARYDGGLRTGSPGVAKPADVVAACRGVDLVVHAGAEKYLDVLRTAGPVTERFPTPTALVRVADRDGVLGGPATALLPIYLRRPDAAEPKQRPRLDVVGPS